MNSAQLAVDPRTTLFHRRLERLANTWVRGLDRALARAHLGGRKAEYDDEAYEFLGGPQERLRAQHYDKSLRLLWKAEEHAPWSSFRDCTAGERSLIEQAQAAMSPEERRVQERMRLPEFRAFLDEHYSRREKEALVGILSAIGHGEAYAWLVAGELLGTVKSTGGKAAITMQVMEEAKHFVVLRELVRAFDVPVPRLSAWEYVMLEQALKAEGLEKFFAMNILVEGIALGMFGMLGHLPGMEILRLFHRDEARHAALPRNYLREFPLGRGRSRSPLRRLGRLRYVLPSIPLVFHLEEDLAVLGIDVFEFAGSVIRKLTVAAERTGFLLPIPLGLLGDSLNLMFNAYCLATRPGFRRRDFRDFRGAETTRARDQRELEAEALGLGAA